MSRSEKTNMYRMIIILLAVFIAVGLVLSRVALFTSAGDANYQLSLLFVIAQTAVIILQYVRWYNKVNKAAADMYNIEEKRAYAVHQIPRYFLVSVLVTGIIAGLAIIAMFFEVLFVDISRVYCYTAVLSEFFAGNITLLIMMRFVGMPDRVYGWY